MIRRLTTGLLCLGLVVTAASAQQIQVKIENLQEEGGFFFTPVWLGFHDGGFDLFDVGSNSTLELATIAETGDVDPMRTLFGGTMNGDATARYDAVQAAPLGFSVPVYEPGEMTSMMYTVPNATSNRYFSFASMVIPSNDAFIGNSNPIAYPVWNADGSFAGPIVIEITGSRVYDAGSEMNDAMGAAFSALGGMDSDESIPIAMHPGLDNFVNTGTASGATITSAIGADEVLARITISAIPEPTSMVLGLGLACGAGMLRRRR